MFMVASSVVTTIMILNYHHRLADTHEMPDWVRNIIILFYKLNTLFLQFLRQYAVGGFVVRCYQQDVLSVHWKVESICQFMI